MSERERWIVYPLLFLALGASLRDKLAKQTRAKQIVCEQLYVVDGEGRPMAELSGEQLRFDLAGEGNGLVIANVVNAQALFQRGQPIATAAAGPSWPQLLQLLQQLGVRFGVAPTPGTVVPRPAAPPAGSDPTPDPAADPIPAAPAAPASGA